MLVTRKEAVGSVTDPSIIAANSGKKQVSPGALLGPSALAWGILRGLEKWKASSWLCLPMLLQNKLG